MKPIYDPIIVAVDVDSRQTALQIMETLKGRAGCFKLGLQLFVSQGPEMVAQATAQGTPIFLDLKLHDIPNTVAHAAVAAGRLGVQMLTLHSLGGASMMEAAREAVDSAAAREGWVPPRLLAVTVLTSHDDDGLEQIGAEPSIDSMVVRLARLALASGMDGVVASARELGVLHQAGLTDLIKVTPGIRPSSAGNDDQRRVLTPGEAISSGADYLVIGRPITTADDPVRAIDLIANEISHARMSE